MALPLKKGAIAVEKDINTLFICDGIDWQISDNVIANHLTNHTYGNYILVGGAPTTMTLWSMNIPKGKILFIDGQSNMHVNIRDYSLPENYHSIEIYYQGSIYINQIKVDKTICYRGIEYHRYDIMLDTYFSFPVDAFFVLIDKPTLIEYKIEQYYITDGYANIQTRCKDYDYQIGII